jgi:hypothetical protein
MSQLTQVAPGAGMFGHSMHRFREKKQIPGSRVVQAALSLRLLVF